VHFGNVKKSEGKEGRCESSPKHTPELDPAGVPVGNGAVQAATVADVKGPKDSD